MLDVEHAGRHLLLTGDLDQLGSVELAASPRTGPAVDLMLAPHHGGKTANTAMLYAWARPRTVIVSQRMPVPGTIDALTSLERSGIPLLRTWQRGADPLSSGVTITSSRKGSWTLTINLDRDPLAVEK